MYKNYYKYKTEKLFIKVKILLSITKHKTINRNNIIKIILFFCMHLFLKVNNSNKKIHTYNNWKVFIEKFILIIQSPYNIELQNSAKNKGQIWIFNLVYVWNNIFVLWHVIPSCRYPLHDFVQKMKRKSSKNSPGKLLA